MIVNAYAKLNLFLDVVSSRDDGYHDLDMVMLPLKLHDSIQIDKTNFNDDYVTCDRIEEKETKYDLINNTLKEMRKRYKFDDHFSVVVHKEIPICAGLGGGSSNAAAVIKAIRSLLKISMTPEEELDLAISLGADVPYCMKNKPAHVEGVGEKVTPISMKKQYYVLIIKPEMGCLTKKIFAEADSIELDHGNVNEVLFALEDGDDKRLATGMMNSLEKVAIHQVPEIQTVKEMFKNDGFNMVLMTGSGSCVYALTTDYWFALKKFHQYDKKGYEVYLTKTLKDE